MRGMFIVDFTSTDNISEDVYNYDILFLVMMMIMRPISPYLLRTTRPRLKAKKSKMTSMRLSRAFVAA